MRGILGAALVGAVLACSQAFGVGVLVPTEEQVPPLAVKYLRVDVTIENQVAKTVVEQVFHNSTSRDLEAKFIFPLPAEATVRDFAMWINGQRTSGEIVEKDKAAQVYQSIVTRMRDPGLLEYLGNNAFRASVYPVPKNGDVKIQIEYTQMLPMQDGLAQYVFPLRTGEKSSKTLEDFSVVVRLTSAVGLKSVYSPSHKVGISRPDDNHATIGMEVDKSTLDRDFTLYYTVSDKEFGLNLVTHRVKGEPGYFMLLIAPRTQVEESKIAKKDVVFVLDVSGSMQGKKIEQAKRAINYCISRLRATDRFDLISFSTDTDTLSKELLAANDENKQQALNYVKKLEAQGGTDINAALTQALALKPDVVVFLTDGKPTIGETDTDHIVTNVEKNKGQSRVFVFGVDEDVNTHLLDKVGEATGGAREYVTPEEDIELKVSSFFNKASNPVLSRANVDLPKVETSDVYPRELGDLFQGSQVLMVGRYKTSGSTAITLSGDVDGQRKTFTYEGEFRDEELGSDFLEGLWARRKVGYLLDQIRLHGENKELVDEVVRLSRKYGIITPYTSYLILEKREDYRTHGVDLYEGLGASRPSLSYVPGSGGAGRGGRRGASGGPAASAAPAPAEPRNAAELAERRKRYDVILGEEEKARREGRAPVTTPGSASEDADRERATNVLRRLDEAKKDMTAQSGKPAMDLSAQLQALKKSELGRGESGESDEGVEVRTVMGRTMVLYYGFWVDADWTTNMQQVSVKYGSDAYFALLKAEPKLKDVFVLGPRLVVVLASHIALAVEDEGKEQLTEAEIKRLVGHAGQVVASGPRSSGK